MTSTPDNKCCYGRHDDIGCCNKECFLRGPCGPGKPCHQAPVKLCELCGHELVLDDCGRCIACVKNVPPAPVSVPTEEQLDELARATLPDRPADGE